MSTERQAPGRRPEQGPSGLLEHLIAFSLRHPWGILAAATGLLLVGGALVRGTPVDVFPDLSAPTVTIITDSPGMAPEEVELLVTFQIESAVNGAPGIRRIRSVSADGLSVVWAEFDWGEDIYRARQVVTERLQMVDLPAATEAPLLGPISSIMGEITFVAMTSETVTSMELRRLAETSVKRALLSLPGVAEVIVIGGEVREMQIELEPTALLQHGLSVLEVVDAVSEASDNPAAGFHVDHGQEYLVRGLGRARSAEHFAAAVVAVRDGHPIRVGDLGRVSLGAAPVRGTGSYRARPAVILSIQKQLDANTLELTERIDRRLAELQTALPDGVVIEKENFRQSDFIEVAIRNVSHALRDGALLVVVVLFLFVAHWRPTLISALAIPLSLVVGVLAVRAFGGSLNTMTLGGEFAIRHRSGKILDCPARDFLEDEHHAPDGHDLHVVVLPSANRRRIFHRQRIHQNGRSEQDVDLTS